MARARERRKAGRTYAAWGSGLLLTTVISKCSMVQSQSRIDTSGGLLGNTKLFLYDSGIGFIGLFSVQIEGEEQSGYGKTGERDHTDLPYDTPVEQFFHVHLL